MDLRMETNTMGSQRVKSHDSLQDNLKLSIAGPLPLQWQDNLSVNFITGIRTFSYMVALGQNVSRV